MSDAASLAEFDYDLPAGAIAQRPVEPRDAARLLVLRAHGSMDRSDAAGRQQEDDPGALEDRTVADLPELLRPGDCLVVNDTRVFPARLVGRKDSGGRIEALLLAPLGPETAGRQLWKAILGASRMPPSGARMVFGEGLDAQLVRPPGAGENEALVELHAPGGVESALERVGQVPLPPYIERPSGPDREDRERYQTVFARERGAAAAPTAGLHFTTELLRRLEARGIRRAAVTLHVGLGTFLPLRDGPLPDRLHAEFFRVKEAAAATIRQTRAQGGRVVAVGTTVVRTLEHAGPGGELQAGEGWCDLFIRPGFAFRQVDLLLTNFHLPRSSLLMLVAAFAGRRRVLAAYRHAIARGYRFYSYGDAMLAERASGEAPAPDPSEAVSSADRTRQSRRIGSAGGIR